MFISASFLRIFAAILFAATAFDAIAYNECNVGNMCGQCRATCNQRAFCVAGEFNTVDKKCTRKSQCLCLGGTTMKRVDALTARKPITP